jgi:hypothetical protein
MQRSRRTNDPLALPTGIHGHSSEGRRWRDLVRNYSAQLGDRAYEAPVRALLSALVACTLRLEQLEEATARGEDTNADQLVHLAHTVRRLLSELGLAPALDGEAGHDLSSHLARRAAERSPVSSPQVAGTDVAADLRERLETTSPGQDEVVS